MNNSSNYAIELIEAVWRKATICPNNDPNSYRRDKCGALIRRDSYGTTGDYGWEIDHIVPKSRGGEDDLSNLRPLHWENNRAKGDSFEGAWTCVVS